MNPRKVALVILVTTSSSLALADDFKTINGKEYKNVTVTQVEPDGVIVKSKTGISKVYFTELSEDVRKQYHYDAGNAAAYTAQVAASVQVAARQAEEFNKQQKLQQQQQAEQAGKQQYGQALMDRLGELQQEEEKLLTRIGQLENRGAVSWSNWNSQGSVHVYANDPAKADLPLFRGRLENVRAEKQRVTAELDRAQRQSR